LQKILAAGAPPFGAIVWGPHRGQATAPARPAQKLTSGEFQKQHEVANASCKSWGETDCQAVFYATAGLTLGTAGH
jgi:hypothetical protein